MNAKTLAKLSLSVGLGASCLFASGLASAAANQERSLDFWLWLFALPDWVQVAAVIVLFTGLSWVVWQVYRYSRHSGNRKLGSRSSYYAAICGGVLGTVVVMLAAGPWKTFLYEKITSLPPTAVGPTPSYRFADDLLTAPDPKLVNAKPQMPVGALAHLPGRARYASVNFNVLSADTINLNLFDSDPNLLAIRTQEISDLLGGSVWVGHIDGYEGSEVILADKGDALLGTVRFNGRFFEIAYVDSSAHVVREIDVTQLPPDDLVSAVYEPVAADAAKSNNAINSTGQVINVAVVYTPNARAFGGGDWGIQSRILNALTAANQSYLNSGMSISLNPVFIGTVNYTESKAIRTSLSRMVSATDGFMDEVYTVRDQNDANLVLLVSTDSDVCGIPTVIKTVSSNYDPSAFAVVRAGCLSAASFALGDLPYLVAPKASSVPNATPASAVATAAVSGSAADTSRPLVKISTSQPGATVSGSVTVTASATDNVGLSGLRLYVDDKMVGATNSDSLVYSWNTNAAGSHTIRADAIDTSGNMGSTSVSVARN